MHLPWFSLLKTLSIAPAGMVGVAAACRAARRVRRAPVCAAVRAGKARGDAPRGGGLWRRRRGRRWGVVRGRFRSTRGAQAHRRALRCWRAVFCGGRSTRLSSPRERDRVCFASPVFRFFLCAGVGARASGLRCISLPRPPTLLLCRGPYAVYAHAHTKAGRREGAWFAGVVEPDIVVRCF